MFPLLPLEETSPWSELAGHVPAVGASERRRLSFVITRDPEAGQLQDRQIVAGPAEAKVSGPSQMLNYRHHRQESGR